MNSQSRFPAKDPAGETLALGASIIHKEAEALAQLADLLDAEFCEAVEWIVHCRGTVVITGMGKAGLIGQKIAATMSSTGTRSHFLHPAEAVHGDLGRVHRDDLVIVLSHSGQTEEVLRILPSLQALQVPVVAITGSRDSQLSRRAELTLWIGAIEEAGPWKLAPSSSTTAMLALGDALALSASRRRGFRPEDFARFHPGGSLGLKLARVEELMRPLEQCRVARENQTVRDVLTTLSHPGRRSGAALLTGQHGELTGIFTDSDLARILETQQDRALDDPIADVMTRCPAVVTQGTMMSSAVEMLVDRKISELPVVDGQGCPLGLIDITDVVGCLPQANAVHTESASEADAVDSATVVASDEGPVIIPWPNQSGNAP